ncbi:MAG: hypothetical protein HYU78_11440 [Rhodocyclales bacterium]|nr:hypothetical protein [Rhodocyclales bacterium]
MTIAFRECVLKIDQIEMVVEHPIASAVEDGNHIYVIFDYSDFSKDHQANNLVCFDRSGYFVWYAENPVHMASSAYTGFISLSPQLVVGNFSGYEVQLNRETGKVQKLRFTK